jgi:hypothetical protein
MFGVAIESHNMPLGHLGLGPDPEKGYDETLLLSVMVERGAISRRAFSLDLRPSNTSIGKTESSP